MNKLLGGGLAAGLAAAGTLAFAWPSSAQEPATVNVVTPEVQQSQAVQLENGEGGECIDATGAAGQIVLSAETEGFAIEPGAATPTNEDGTWQIDFSVIDEAGTPVPFAVGAYTGQAQCVGADGTTPVFDYAEFAFTVVPDPGAPPEDPAEPPAAPPAPETPQGGRDTTG